VDTITVSVRASPYFAEFRSVLKGGNEGIIVSKAAIHFSEAEAAGDFAGRMARVRPFRDLLMVQDDIAGEVTNALGVSSELKTR
jgi:hypothetical protein